MAPGQILIELVIPIVSVAATILGAFVVKKRRDKKKAEACKTGNLRDKVESLEHRLGLWTEAYTREAASQKYVEAQIQSAVDSLRVECAKQDEFDRLRERLKIVRDGTSSKGEMERHVHEACERILDTATSWDEENRTATLATLRSEFTQEIKQLHESIANAVKKIAQDAESDVEVDMTDVRKEINKKLQEYDLAITKWTKKQIEDHQPKISGTGFYVPTPVSDDAPEIESDDAPNCRRDRLQCRDVNDQNDAPNWTKVSHDNDIDL